jgi:hypothetical protein
MVFATELAHLVKDSQPLLQVNVLTVTAIITVPTMQITAMSDMPLQGEYFSSGEGSGCCRRLGA